MAFAKILSICIKCSGTLMCLGSVKKLSAVKWTIWGGVCVCVCVCVIEKS